MTLLDIWQVQYRSDFGIGVQLLQRHNPQAVTKAILVRLRDVAAQQIDPSPYELAKLTNALSISVVPDDQSYSSIAAVTGLPTLNAPTRESPTVQSQPVVTSERAKNLHKEHGHSHAMMVASDTDADRATHARAIMEEIIPALDNEYAKLRGDAEPDEVTIAKKTTTGIRQLHSIRTRIARLRKHLIPNQKDPKKRAILEKELAEKIAQKEALEDQLA